MKIDELFALIEGMSANGSMGLGGSGKSFDVVNDNEINRDPGESPKTNGGRNIDKPKYESFMGVRDSDTLDKQDSFKGSQENGGFTEAARKKSELEKASEKEQGEHPWASKKIAAQIARDHMKEQKITLKEFFNIDEASDYGSHRRMKGGFQGMSQDQLRALGNASLGKRGGLLGQQDEMKNMGWKSEPGSGKWTKGDMWIQKDQQGAGLSTADEETPDFGDKYLLYVNYKLVAAGKDLVTLAKEAEQGSQQ